MNARQPIGDFPTMASSTYVSNTYAGDSITTTLMQQFSAPDQPEQFRNVFKGEDIKIVPRKEEVMGRRLVKVIITDPNENIPLDQCVLYSGNEKVTDATDQELYFEIDVKPMLDRYNTTIRTKTRNKAVKDREEFLEPARIRDLKLVVVKIADL